MDEKGKRRMASNTVLAIVAGVIVLTGVSGWWAWREDAATREEVGVLHACSGILMQKPVRTAAEVSYCEAVYANPNAVRWRVDGKPEEFDSWEKALQTAMAAHRTYVAR